MIILFQYLNSYLKLSQWKTTKLLILFRLYSINKQFYLFTIAISIYKIKKFFKNNLLIIILFLKNFLKLFSNFVVLWKTKIEHILKIILTYFNKFHWCFIFLLVIIIIFNNIKKLLTITIIFYFFLILVQDVKIKIIIKFFNILLNFTILF